jgi:hypothetical protein
MELKDIEKEFLSGGLQPVRLAELRVQLGGKYSVAMNNLEHILKQKPVIWNEMRKDFKSDSSCERAWEATEFGQDELHWTFQRKKIEKLMSACKSLIDLKTAEGYNQM